MVDRLRLDRNSAMRFREKVIALTGLLTFNLAWSLVPSYVHVSNQRGSRLFRSATLMQLADIDVGSMSVKEALGAVAFAAGALDRSLLYNDLTVSRTSPGLSKYIIANPKAFINNPDLARSFGCVIQDSCTIADIAESLPVIYIADKHSEYGTLGYALHRRSEASLADLFAGMKAIRNQSVYLGGSDKRGSSFTMIHQKVGFPENRPLKGAPDPAFRLFFSPDIAMANELCLTNDAAPSDFKFFQWATVWPPRQLEEEYQNKLWITVEGSLELFFSDTDPRAPMWTRVVQSLPPGTVSVPHGIGSS